jgi:hypothetical protein
VTVAGGERTVKVKFSSDESDLIRGTDKVDRALDTVGSSFGRMNDFAMAASLGILAAGAAVIGFSAASLANIERLNAQTTQTIKSMNAAWTNTDAITAYAQKIEKLTGLEAEQVQGAQNLLLTFGNIRNELGAGNDIFDQATSIVADMSVVFGQDMSAAAVQLGKALNDPLKGITALSKIGVSFTEQQKEQIKNFVEAGDVMGAQRVILAELTREVGGAAEAFGDTTAGKVAKFRNEVGDLGEALVVGLMPALDKWVDRGRDVAQWLTENEEVAGTLATTVLGVAAAVIAMNAAIATYEAIAGAVTLVTSLWTAAQWALNIAMYASPLGLAIIAIGLIVLGVGLITKGMEGLGVTWGDVWRGIVDVAVTSWDWVAAKSMQVWRWLTETAPAGIRDAFYAVRAFIVNPFIDAFNFVARQWNNTIGKLSVDLPGVGKIDVQDIPYAQRFKYGGTTRAGMPYVIGDGSGPELFVPSSNGTVVPNPGEGGSWGGDTYVSVEIGGETVAAIARRERVDAGKSTRRWVLAAGGTA